MPKWVKVLIIVLIAIAAVAAIIFGITVAAGMKIYNETQDTLEDMDETMNSMYVSMFNAQFMPYFGKNIRGSEVKALIINVETNNETSEDKVTLSGITTADEIENSAKYTVKESYAKNGMINKITITKN